MKLKAIIIDDERGNIDALKALLAYLPEISIIAEYQNPIEAISGIIQLRPQILFLDIMMPEMDGFALLKRLPVQPPVVIFVTAANDRGIEALKARATDYLLKPIIFSELKEAVAKASKLIEKEKTIRKISLATSEGYEILEPNDVIRLKGSGSYCEVFINNRKPLVLSKNIGDVCELFSQFGFKRVHTSHVVNPVHILRYLKEDGGALLMTDKAEVPISRRRKEEVLDWIKAIE